MLKYCRTRVGLTMGDPSGIGPAVILRALQRLSNWVDFTVIGDRWVLEKTQNSKLKTQNFKLIDLNNVSRKNFKFGRVKAEYGRASIEYLDRALQLIKDGQIDCLVTSPVCKEAVNLARIKFSGHTEYLGQKTGVRNLGMMLLNKQLRISLVTRHIPIKKVSGQLNRDRLYKTILITHHSLKKLFLLDCPRLVVCGLNPHASDNGLIGDEENKVIAPVIKKLKGTISVDGPLSADAALHKSHHGEYDCAIAMYHDQALIPLKLSDKNAGVNLTLGLPFVRTSPLHGTAFDIAPDYSFANPDSLIAAIKLAIRCTLNLKRASVKTSS